MTTPYRRSAAWLLVAVSSLCLALAWVLASPVGASPDEATQINYAWGTVTGQTIVGERLVKFPGGMSTMIRVPQKLLQYPDPSCYMFHPEKPVVQCSPIPADNLQVVTRASYTSGYPPLFYAVEGVVLRAATAVDLSGPRVLYGARLASAVLSLLVVGFGVLLLSRRFPAPVVLLATLLALPPMAWFLAASVNANGLEVAAAFLLAAGVLSLRVDDTVGVRSIAAVLAVPLGTLLLAWNRPLSWVWASLILGLLLVPTGRQNSESWKRRLPLRRLGMVSLAATVLTLTSSILWFGYAFHMRSSGPGTNANLADWTGLNPAGRVVLLLLNSGTIVSELIGTFGWLDTPLPTAALLAWVSVAAVAAVVWVVGRSTLVPRWPVGAVLGLGYLAALLDEYKGAWGWQGRYFLPVIAAVCVFAIPGLMDGLERLAALRRVVSSMLVALMAVNALSVVWFLFRNVYGVKVWPQRLPPAPLPVGTSSWTPPLGSGVVLGLVALALACGVVAVWTLRPVPASTEQQSSH